MISVELRAKPKVKSWLRSNEINIKILDTCLNIFLNSVREFNINDFIILEIKICNDVSSGYYFGFDELHITKYLDQYGWSKEKKFDTFVCHLLHELRHWIQDNMLHVDEGKLSYSVADYENSRPKYYYNKWEVDARRFERRYKKEFIDLYLVLEKLSTKPDLK